MDMEKIYKNLTGIDIEKQKEIWDERGKGYWGEYCLLKQLYMTVHGNCKFLMNVQIPTGEGKTTEIDLLMIHESGICCFEAKYYQGIIYGDFEDDKWTQFLRTRPNNTFRSPIKQNAYHINALKRMFPAVPVSSFVVFTNNDVNIDNLRGWQESDMVLCKLENMEEIVDRINHLAMSRLTQNDIETIFLTLKSYSPLSREVITENDQIIPFVDYVNQIRIDLNEELEAGLQNIKKKYRKKNLLILGITLLFCFILLIAGSYSIVQEEEKARSIAADAKHEAVSAKQAQASAEAAQASAEQAFEEFSKKFRKVEPLNGGDVQLEDNFVEVYDLILEKSPDLKDTYLFSCRLKIISSEYGIRFHQNTAIVIHFKDGSVAEYLLKDWTNAVFVFFGGPFFDKSGKVPQIQIFTPSADNILYIKLIKAAIVSGTNPQGDLLPGTEFVLYEKK